MKNWAFNWSRLEQQLIRTLIRHSANPRPSSHPFLSGDSFRALADWRFDETEKVRAEQIRQGDIVFLKTDLLEQYQAQVHRAVTKPYVLLSGNSDRNITQTEIEWLDQKIKHWFAQNANVTHPKITPLPIGLENKYLYHYGIPAIFAKARQHRQVKQAKIFYRFSIQTNQSARAPALEILQQIPVADTVSIWPEPQTYVQILAQYQFVASPVGHGLDCHRNWEALYLNTIPITLRSPNTEQFTAMGFPFLLLDNWDELAKMDTAFLNQQWSQLTAAFDQNKLFMNYWENLIKRTAKAPQ